MSHGRGNYYLLVVLLPIIVGVTCFAAEIPDKEQMRAQLWEVFRYVTGVENQVKTRGVIDVELQLFGKSDALEQAKANLENYNSILSAYILQTPHMPGGYEHAKKEYPIAECFELHDLVEAYLLFYNNYPDLSETDRFLFWEVLDMKCDTFDFGGIMPLPPWSD